MVAFKGIFVNVNTQTHLSFHIFWQVGSSATFGTTSVFKGTVLAMQSITFDTGASLNGRAMARTGAVVMAGNTIVKE
jgi:hypothetical protein